MSTSVHLQEKRTVIIIHDAYSEPTSHWYQYIKTNLADSGYDVMIPKFPTPIGQSLEGWKNVWSRYISRELSPETIIIAHGVGCAFVLRMLGEYTQYVRSVYLIAPYTKDIGQDAFTQINNSFLEGDFNWDYIKKRYQHIDIIGSSNDPYVPFEFVLEVAENLGEKPIDIKKGLHFMGQDEYSEFSYLLDQINKTIKSPELSPKERMEQAIFDTRYEKSDTNIEAGGGIAKVAGVTTYYDELSRAASGKQAEVMAEVIEEEKEKTQEQKIKNKVQIKRILFAFGAVVFLVAGIFMVWFFLTKKITQVPVDYDDISQLIVTPLSVDFNIELDEYLGKMAEFRDKKHSGGSVYAFRFSKKTEDGVVLASFDETLKFVDMDIPEGIISDISGSMFGVYINEGQIEPYILFKSDSMLGLLDKIGEWETSLFADTETFFLHEYKDISFIQNTGSGEFLDAVLDNTSYRAFVVPRPDISLEIKTEDLPISESYFVLPDGSLEKRGDTKPLYSFKEELVNGANIVFVVYGGLYQNYILITRNPGIISDMKLFLK